MSKCECGLSWEWLELGKNPEQWKINHFFVMCNVNVPFVSVSGEASDGCNLRLM